MNTRKSIRLNDWDYTCCAVYHVIICTHEKRKILGTVSESANPSTPANVALSRIGRLCCESIMEAVDRYKEFAIPCFVIMPNHVHLLIHARGGGVSLGSFIGYIKGRTSYKLGKYKNSNIWQRGYYDHIIRGRADYQNTWDYIENNPAKWADDEYYSEQ